jgi:hypothetical protein
MKMNRSVIVLAMSDGRFPRVDLESAKRGGD